MVSPKTIRSCTACLTRRISSLQQQPGRSFTTLVKPPRRGTLASTKGRIASRTHNNTRGTAMIGSAPTNRTLKSSRTVAGHRRRKATLAGDAAATRPNAAAPSAARRITRQDVIKELGTMLGQPRTIPIPRWVSPKHYSLTLSECFGHGSFILVAISYAVDDFLWLRIIAVAGSTSMLFFSYFHPHGRVLWLPFKWNLLFIAINSYRIGKVFLDRYLANQLSDELRETRSKHFYLMDPVDFGRLSRVGQIETFQKGDIIVEQDQPNSHVRLVLSGGLKVLHDNKITYTLEEGNFVSESGLHAGLMLPDSVDSCCTIVAESDARLLAWDRTELVDLLNRQPHVRRSLKAVLSWDIVRKLKAQRNMLSDHVIEDPEAWTHRRHEQTEHRYKAILKNLLSTHDESEMTNRKRELTKYRTIHHIDDEHHREALNHCGWTVEEFETGHKENSPNNQDRKSRHGPDWYVREAIERIVG